MTPQADNLLFLDIDGVLVTWDDMRQGLLDDSRARFNKKCVAELLKLVKKFEMKIVISSTWRFGFESFSNDPMGRIGAAKFSARVLKRRGLVLPVIGMTPSNMKDDGPRGLEIQKWLDINDKNNSNFLILDDDDDMEHLSDHLIRTHMDRGFTVHHRKLAETMMHKQVLDKIMDF